MGEVSPSALRRESTPQPRRGHERILVVEPEADARKVVLGLLKSSGYLALGVADSALALEILGEFEPSLALVDVDVGGPGGAGFVREVKRRLPGCACVMTTRYPSLQAAVDAVHQGADDYLLKPLQAGELGLVVDRELRRLAPTPELLPTTDVDADRDTLPEIIGESPQIRTVKALIRRAAPSRASVLVTGESGTGKELIASALHRLSPRRTGPFVAVNCAALPESLLESELFGHEKGAFTGATVRKEGRFELAHGGTLFLDEIGEIAPSTQVKLLRVLQEHEFERVGGTRTLSVDVRVIAATNTDLRRLVAQDAYRGDLYYRLNVLNIQAPPLRHRRRDIPLLWEHLLSVLTRAEDREPLGTDADVMACLLAYDWPGNVRELRNAAEYATVMCHVDEVALSHLPPYLVGGGEERDPLAIRVPGMTLADLERAAILRTYEALGSNAHRTAAMLGISIRKIRYRLKQYREMGLLPERR